MMARIVTRAVLAAILIALAWSLTRRKAADVATDGGARSDGTVEPLASAPQRVFGSPKGPIAPHETLSRRVVAVADLHGDLEHAHNVFRMAGIMDDKSKEPDWRGGHDVLVSTGDIVDRGDDTIPLYRMFQRLRDQARAQGGDVHNCIGNHEMMNALMDWRYVTQGDFDSFGTKAQRRHAMSTEGWIGQEWLANYSMSHTVPLLPIEQLPLELVQSGKYTAPHASFVHGGIHPIWAARGLEDINRVGHSLLEKALSEERPSGWLPHDATPDEKSFYGEHGPLWYRGYALEDEGEVCKEAEDATHDLGVTRLIMGHTPHFSGFVVRCNGKVLLIDTGISRAYGGEQSALILDTELRPDVTKGGPVRQWTETSTITALYRGRMPKVLQTSARTISI